MIRELSKRFSNLKIIVRPHPSENHEYWEKAISDCVNVSVVHDGNVIPWLLASDVLIHNGCTTAVEAALVNKKAISYMPIKSRSFDYHLPNNLSIKTSNREELILAVGKVLNSSIEEVDAAAESLLKKHVAGSGQATSSELVLDVLDEYLAVNPHNIKRGHLQFFIASLLVRGRTLVKQFNRRRKGHRNSKEYHDHRFPGITLADLQSKIELLCKDNLKLKNIKAKQESKHIFKIYFQ